MDTTYTNDHVPLMTIPVSGIPKGYRVVAIRPALSGEIVANDSVSEGVSVTPDFWNRSIYSDFPMIILEKLYNPGIPIPNGWKVWRNNCGVWGASETGDSVWRIVGLQHFPEFVPPTNNHPATVVRQS